AAVASGTTTFTVDTTAPTVALTYSLDASAYNASVSRPVKTGDTVTIKATMTEVVALSAAPTITLTATGGVTPVTATPMTQVGSSLVYTYAYAVQASQNGTVSASVSATDTATNALTSTAATAFIVDNTAPTVVLAYAGDGHGDLHRDKRPLRDADPLPRCGNLDGYRRRDLAGGDALQRREWPRLHGDLHDPGRERHGDRDGRCHRHGGEHPVRVRPDRLHHRQHGADYVYTVVLANAGTYVDGTATVSVSGTDLAGNTGTTVTSGGTFAIDTTAPVVSSVVRASSAAALTTGASAPVFTVTFSESVSGVTAANFAVNAGSGIGGTAPTIASVTGTGTAWTVTLGVTGTTGDYGSNTNATLGLTVVPASNAVDAAGNALASATVSGTNESYNLDTT
ncbi:MAG: hypothetical protein EBT22_13450, partial [Chloroflexi bacterium]|nr:hypothetical protein [Chloroflexota bacterium]